ncbi:MAG: ATP-binding protein [Chloroflexota bacterium]
MSAFFIRIGSLLADPPGNLIYLLVLAFSVAGTLQATFFQWRAGESVRDRRALLGLGAMLAALAAFFLLGIAVAAPFPGARASLPPLDRAVTFILFTWAIWVWAFPEPGSQPDLWVWLLTGLAVAAGGVSVFTQASRATALGYNQTAENTVWQIATVGLLGVGAALLYIRRTEGFVNGMAFLGLAFLGHAVHLVAREAGDYSGILRLAHVAAFPLLLTLSQRFGAAPAGTAQEARAADPKRYGADPKTVHALLSLAAETDTAKLNQAMARAVARTMLSDLCFIMFLTQDKGQVDIAGGYDLIREDYLQGTRLDSTRVPRLANSIRRGRPLRLPATGTVDDIRGLGDLLGLKDPGNLLSAPIITPDNEPLGALVLLSPYSHREWSAADQNLLVSIAGGLVSLIQRSRQARMRAPQADGLPDALRSKEEEVLGLRRRNDDLAQQLETMALEGEKVAAESAELASLLTTKERSEVRIRQLETELESAKGAGRVPDPQLEEQLRATLRDLAHLQNELAASNQKVLELESHADGERRKKEQAEVIASISQELRQPMSSIIGYTDLLLGESVGILGALQRKFVERIKASTERIGGLIDDMIQLTTLEVGLSELKPEAMDLNLIIDNALAYTSSQVREKKIAIHLDLPRSVAPVNADREALQQILIHLLQNAGAATPVEGTIALKVLTTVDEGKSYVMVQVTDSGGGIPEEDLPRVFTRLFRADNVLIQGVGDTGVGLSIAKTLTEAQHGRIWVESQPGSGATFCVLLPAVGDTIGRMPGKEAR